MNAAMYMKPGTAYLNCSRSSSVIFARQTKVAVIRCCLAAVPSHPRRLKLPKRTSTATARLRGSVSYLILLVVGSSPEIV